MSRWLPPHSRASWQRSAQLGKPNGMSMFPQPNSSLSTVIQRKTFVFRHRARSIPGLQNQGLQKQCFMTSFKKAPARLGCGGACINPSTGEAGRSLKKTTPAIRKEKEKGPSSWQDTKENLKPGLIYYTIRALSVVLRTPI